MERVIPKGVLAKEIASILRQRNLTQTEAAWLMKDAPSQVSLVVTGKLRGFSTERLLRMLARLGAIFRSWSVRRAVAPARSAWCAGNLRARRVTVVFDLPTSPNRARRSA